MITNQLLRPASIVVVGASNNVHKPGGAILRNLINGGYCGALRVVNPKETEVQGIPSFGDVKELPNTELAILAIPAALCPDVVEMLASQKQTRAFIILSAGFGEETHEGALLEDRILATVNKYQASLIGPNCIGLMNTWHHSVFTLPIPNLHAQGVDLISSSGATAVFILESAVVKGLQFNSVWSVGNAKQIGVEEVLQHMDETFNPATDSNIKLIYMESIKDPDRLLFHASSLIRKGCKIAAIKAGSSESGSRAASSHTGAIASSDSAVEALFRKAGIVRCFSREELTTVGCIFTLPELKGKNFAIVTHAGGPGVMLTDALSKGGLNVPKLEGPSAEELKSKLFPGASVGNPIDILATGTPEHLSIAIDYCENKFDNIDAIFAIFGTPGLVTMFETYEVLHQKMLTCRKPVFPILPSIHTAGEEVGVFLQKGHVNFADEVTLGTALSRIVNVPRPATPEIELFGVDVPRIRRIIDSIPENGYIEPHFVQALLRSAGIPVVDEFVSAKKEEVLAFARRSGFPVVAKVVGPVHKSDVGGVVLHIKNEQHLALEFDRMMQIPDAHSIMVQPMLKGIELFIGAKYEEKFGHVVLCGLGGIFVEVLGDVSSGLAPLSYEEAHSMIRSLRAYKIIQGTRGQKGVNEVKFAEIIVRLSTLLRFATEIKEMDMNPLLATEKNVIAVDARIRIEK
ncbi:MAG: acetate--CoA ligase family protein [Bacteroides sp.]|uniref:acetate--CoA ligase family protein n=1 Tax=Bacteroides sp. TaxID=29523 RepID=UPI001B5415DC|nr:acetate--CoA ligase [Bacteroides sp.]MBP6066070.1 acetate--CoA ligase family protein [Bacteroides sp.]MBP6068307.1 acetate--CoA ligase family protein [Bacteroides sp.]MBP8622862.1 acetate--CoA ligase family protein [Bacteroides sp.]MBP9507272.1 acetate--CoA ligase family protein [Bacteroides sp.]MBP9586447.1 acetate--CoA ligase family protein [Bacteroides sp.]